MFSCFEVSLIVEPTEKLTEKVPERLAARAIEKVTNDQPVISA